MSTRRHGARDLEQDGRGFYLAGMKSYGRAQAFLMITGYEQVRTIAADIAGDREAAERVEPELRLEPASGRAAAWKVVLARLLRRPGSGRCRSLLGPRRSGQGGGQAQLWLLLIDCERLGVITALGMPQTLARGSSNAGRRSANPPLRHFGGINPLSH